MSHNRTVELLNPEFDWKLQTSDDRTEILNRCLDDAHELRTVWERWKGRSVHDIMDWNPGMYLPGSEHLRIYCTYFPIIISRCDNRKLVCFNSNRFLNHAPLVSSAPREWMNKPALDFLPSGVDNIIAGRGGLLVVNGSIRPRHPDLENKPIPSDPTVKSPPPPPAVGELVKPCSEHFPEQSTLVVCNPLQRTYHILPRHSHFKMHNKVAKMVLVENSPVDISDLRLPRRDKRHPDFKIYVLGEEVIETGTLEANSNKISLFTYDSRFDSWLSCSSLHDARLPPHGRTDIAIVGDRLYFGGQARTDITVRRVGGKAESTWVNKIFYVEISMSRWNQISFSIPDLANIGQTLDCQAPRVLQCQNQSAVYIATRPLRIPDVIQVWKLEIYSKLPTGGIKYVTQVPNEYFYGLMFGRINSHKAWDCSAGRNYLAFVPAFDETMPEICMYEVDKGEWNFSRRPAETGQMAKYQLAHAEWTPCFGNTLPVSNDMRKECACLDRLNPSFWNPADN
ncbi:uncharacterized protein [Physcomitrium patens]|uniref:Uncharacterized protein n=1 Tax=Physcomitrium patens TaxID=3218 RepID=A9TBD9_PHYPA|nr:hypothetical protein PHYPA_005305 [Physcomitrium patens]